MQEYSIYDQPIRIVNENFITNIHYDEFGRMVAAETYANDSTSKDA